ncbi:hypothetical protein [Enterococcus gallinarum]|uniref:Phage protein n=1 Tax=Enterococcus gallinarum TaxID=1353 RepID=A0A376GYP7_ENTGA|nr:hypothetical protein [Enterococcus gallinarum]MBE6171035.1 hypothetical protein [Enterococcus casseliflavus]NQE03289.1 hypothetical protein [Enterococcus gallinarum]STD71705.1 phage protein [Enterococcus gallinarum]STD83667.1 phage protein [Enterococcus gallinarum]
MSKNINVPLSGISDGGLQERFDFELAQVINNIHDPNTDPTKKRKITIDLTITPDEYREDILIDYQVKSKLVARDSLTSKVIIGQDERGKPQANELKSGQRGQMYFDPEDSELKDDKGTPVKEIEETAKIKKFKTN